MARLALACVATLLLAAGAVSPVQKVVELLEECKGKIVKDLKAEEAAMEEYTTFCDDELTEKGYAIKTSTRSIQDLKAEVEDSQATISELQAEIASLGTEMSDKDKELAKITSVRKAEKSSFEATEKELMGTIGELGGAIAEIKQATSFLQLRNGHKATTKAPMDRIRKVAAALSRIVDAAWVSAGNRQVVTKFIQQTSGEDDELSFHSRQEPAAEAPTTGGIVVTLEDMKEKAEASLTEARNTELKGNRAFELMQQGLQNELKTTSEKKSDASTTLESESEALGKAQGELGQTERTKAADEAYVASLTVECQQTAEAWAARQGEAKEEMAAVDKAKEILVGGVKAFVQVSSRTRGSDDDLEDAARTKLVGKLKSLARRYHSFALMEMVTAAGQDPFAKIRGLIEDMVGKLVAEANEEATQKAFCDEELGKSKKSQQEKTMDLDKLRGRADKAETTKATLEGQIKQLEAEISDIDSAQAEATKIRNQENADYQTSSKDFRDSAEATEQAIVVLKQYYEGALLQKAAVVTRKSAQPSFGSSKGETGHTIIAILEMAAEDFTKTYTEIEAEEQTAVTDFEKLTQENRVSRAAKEAEAKAKASEVKSLTVTLADLGTDIGGVSKELDAVLSYLDKLKPQCETKAMSYEEKKQRREAEIEGLKEALSILDGSAPML